MNVHHQPTTARRLSLLVAGLAATVTAALPVSATAMDKGPSTPTICAWTVDQLPRTPDAVEGWYRGCGVQRLGTPDAMEGWLR